ncbi:MAG: glycosyltransferase [Clostridia bacterium]|nr:glycosyltransferase [Clostridia bacterium]
MYKICYVTTVPGTIRTFILKCAEYLYSTGEFDISFICNEDEAFGNSVPEYFHYFPVRMTRGIAVDGLRAIKEMRKIFKREKFDLVQYSTPNASCYASIAAKQAGVPVRLYCQWGLVYVGFEGIKRAFFKSIEKMVCRNSTWIEPDSYGNLKFSHDEGLYPENKGSVVWNGSASGVSLEKFDISKKPEYRKQIREKYGIPEEAFVFGFMGRINGDKGVNELFTAMRDLSASNDDVRLMVVGKPEISRGVDMTLYGWAKGCPKVIFTGYTTTPEQYLSAVDCYVLPSYREGFGMTVIEAETMELPVIVTNIPGPTDGMIKDVTGLVVEKKDADGLRAAMEEMIGSLEKRSAFAAKGREFAVGHFEQKTLFEKILKDRKRLLGQD